MFNKINDMKFGLKLSIGFSLVLFLTVLIVTFSMLNRIESVIDESEERELHHIIENIKATISFEGKLAESLSAVIANIPDVQEAMASQDRDRLAEMLVSSFEVMKKQYGVRQFQFHTPPAISFLRVHKPTKFGDDLSSFRKTVVKANRESTVVRGVEKGVAGLGIRGMVPVKKDNKHLGTLEFGMSFGEPFFEMFKSIYNVDVGLHMIDGNSFKLFASTLSTPLLSTEQLKEAIKNKNVTSKGKLESIPVAVYGSVLKDFSGKPIGVIEAVMNRENHVAALNDAKLTSAIIGAIAILVGILVALYLSLSVSKPICKVVTSLVASLNEISNGEGDLTKTLNVSGSFEVNQLSDVFNHFMQTIRNLVSEVNNSSEKVSNSAEQLTEITNHSSNILNGLQSETDQVATAMNEMTSTVQEVANHANHAAEAAKQAADESVEGRAVVVESIASIQKLASDVENAALVINALGDESNNIGSVLDVIKGIAEQTNLLALNAAIEAARAGEQGRGFAVVADEVRSLAARTQESTQEIENLIEKLQTQSKSAVDVMSEGRSQASASVDQATKAGDALDTIMKAVNSISEMNVQIATAAEEQSAVAEEINCNVINIKNMNEETAQGAQKIAFASNDLTSLSENLRNQVCHFKI